MRYFTALIALVVVASVASAATTGGFTENATGTAAGVGVVNDLVINTTVDWTSAVLTVNAPGSIYQNGLGSNVAPLQAWIGVSSDLEWDTYAAGGTFSTASLTGPAASFTSPPAPVMDANDILVTFYTDATNNTGSVDLARVTIDSAFTGGSWSALIYNADSAGTPALELSGTIVNGALVPEPASMLIMAIGGIGVLARRRRK